MIEQRQFLRDFKKKSFCFWSLCMCVCACTRSKHKNNLNTESIPFYRYIYDTHTERYMHYIQIRIAKKTKLVKSTKIKNIYTSERKKKGICNSNILLTFFISCNLFTVHSYTSLVSSLSSSKIFENVV